MRRGLLLAAVSAVAFGLSGSFASALLRTGWSPGAVVLVRVAIAALALAPAAFLAARRGGLRRPHLSRLALFGVLGVGCAQLCYFSAVGRISVGLALMLEYSGTVLVVGWEWLTEGRTPRAATLLGGGLALAGLSIALGVWSGARVDPVGIGWGLGAAVGLAAYFVISARADDAPHPLVTASGGLVVGATALGVAAGLGALPLTAADSSVVLSGTRVPWTVPVLALGIVTGALAYATGVLAAQRLGATVASFVGLLEVLAAVVAAWALVGQHLGLAQLAGGVLVLAGVALVQRGRAPAEPVGEPELVATTLGG